MYNLTELMNTTDYGTYIGLLNQESNYILGITLMFTVVLIVLIGVLTSRESFGTAATVAGLSGTIVGIILFALEALSPEYIIIPLLIGAGGFIGVWISRD